jgi:ketosteroid isomerase-like protein
MADQGGAGKQVVEDFLKAFFEGRVDDALAIFAPDVELVEPEGLSYGGKRHGRESFGELNAILADLWEFGELSPQFFDLGDGRVLLQGRFRATAKKTGKYIDTQVIEFYTVENSQIARVELMIDTVLVEEALTP